LEKEDYREMMKRVKRIIGLLAMAVLLVSPSLGFASGQMGVYVTPKFVYGYLKGYDMKEKGWHYNSGALDDTWTINESMESDHIFGGALAVGYDFSKKLSVPVRGELEYAIFSDAKATRDDGTKLDLGIQTIFANVYYDFRNSSAFTPYLGFGLGMGIVKAKGDHWGYSMGSKTSTNFAWNVGAGVAYAFTDMISLDLAYRFVSPGKGQTKKALVWEGSLAYDDEQWKTKNLYIHQVMLGVRFTF